MTTDTGIVRFDGLRFCSFLANDTPGITTDHYTSYALHEDRQGALWAGTNGGGLLRYQRAKFRSFTVKDGLPDDGVRRIDEAMFRKD